VVVMAEENRSATRDWLGNGLVTVCCLIVGGILIYASLDKIAQPDSFAKAVHNYRLLPLPLLHPFAVLLPWLELVIGITIIIGVARRGAALLALALTVMFIVAVSAALVRKLDISCGCFHTDGGSSVGLDLLIRDILLLILILPPLLSRYAGWSLRSLFHRSR
jgi:uncharacterized membrane protein YphA (DoxX/SURF4 family)